MISPRIQVLEEKIIELETRLFQADVRASAEELDKLLADQFYEIGASGEIYNKAQILENLVKLPEVKITANEYDLVQMSSEIVLVTYRALIRTEKEQRSSLRSSIWKFIENKWQMVFHQGTPAEK